MKLNIAANGLIMLSHNIAPANEQVVFAPHGHPLNELAFYLQGNITFAAEGLTLYPPANSIMFIPQGYVHTIHTDAGQPYDRYVLHFSSEILPETLREHFASTLFSSIHYLEEMTTLLPELRALETCFSLPEYVMHDAVKARVAALLTQTSFYCDEQNALQDDDDIVPKVLECIHMNIHDPHQLTADALAQRFFMSKNQLNKLFQRNAGVSISKYVRIKRYEYAEMLRAHGMPAAEAAARAGYQSYSTYYRIRCTEPHMSPPTVLEKDADILLEPKAALGD